MYGMDNSSQKFRIRPKSERKACNEGESFPSASEGWLLCLQGAASSAECPTATNEQKEEARRVLAARRAERLKHIDTGAVSGHTVTINEVLEVPFCADSGADSNILSRSMVEELCALDSSVVLAALEPPRMTKVHIEDRTTQLPRWTTALNRLDGDITHWRENQDGAMQAGIVDT
ncbi:hypothetical protein GQ600_6249 [Phytophthora cactorum]|nr:hypothetical protein GQ600_6249 [Phytophthora cactorum]